MKKSYLVFLFFAGMLFFQHPASAQNNTSISLAEKQIEGLNIYPNPVHSASHSVLTIQSKSNLNKSIEFYDVLGKRLFATILRGSQLNISNINPGIYILKITENNISEARKLVIK